MEYIDQSTVIYTASNMIVGEVIAFSIRLIRLKYLQKEYSIIRTTFSYPLNIVIEKQV